MEGQDNLISLADVARLAGVTRPAASNWRRRSADFPKPVRDTGAASLFDRAEITAWLARHGKQFVRPSLREEIAAALNTVRAGTTTDAMARTWLAELADGVEQSTLSRLVDEHGASEVCEALIAEVVSRERRDPWLDVPSDVVDLVLSLAEPYLTGTVYDPACGLGTLLLAAHGVRPVRLVGHSVSPDALAIAAMRMAIHGISAELREARNDPPQTDVVLTANLNSHYVATARWLEWSVGRGGHGFHVTPHSAVTRRRDRAKRAELLRRGVVRAVVELPAHRAALWVLNDGAVHAEKVLLIDAGDALDEKAVTRVVTILRNWQSSGELPGDDLLAIAVERKRLLAGECRLDVASWVPADLTAMLDKASASRERMRSAAAALAEPTSLPDLTVAKYAHLSIGDLIESGEVELVRDARMSPEELGPQAYVNLSVFYPGWFAEQVDPRGRRPGTSASEPGKSDSLPRPRAIARRGDVLLVFVGDTVHAAVVPDDGGVVAGQVHCLRLRTPSVARSLAIAALLPQEARLGRFTEVQDLVVPWPSDEECERIARVLDVLTELRRRTEEAFIAAEDFENSTLAALRSGAVPVDDRWGVS